MRKIREVLRLHSLGLAQRQIARSCSLGQSTVSEYLKAAEAARLQWPEVADWDEARLAAALLPRPASRARAGRQTAPDFASIHTELQQHKHLTLQLVWEEYRANHPDDGYRYSRFCELYQRWRRKQEVVLRQEHRAGEKLFVRLDPRSSGAQRPSHRTQGRIPAQEARPEGRQGECVDESGRAGLSIAGRSEGTQSPSPRSTPHSPLKRRTNQKGVDGCRSLSDDETSQRRFAPTVIAITPERRSPSDRNRDRLRRNRQKLVDEGFRILDETLGRGG